MKRGGKNLIKVTSVILVLFVISCLPAFSEGLWSGKLDDGAKHNSKVLAEFNLKNVPDKIEIGFTSEQFPNGLTVHDEVSSKKSVVLTPSTWGKNVSTTDVRAYYQIISKTPVTVYISASPLKKEDDSSVKLGWGIKDVNDKPTLSSSLNIADTDKIKERSLYFIHTPTGENGAIGIAGYEDFEIEVKGENYINAPVGNYYGYIYLSIESRA